MTDTHKHHPFTPPDDVGPIDVGEVQRQAKRPPPLDPAERRRRFRIWRWWDQSITDDKERD